MSLVSLSLKRWLFKNVHLISTIWWIFQFYFSRFPISFHCSQRRYLVYLSFNLLRCYLWASLVAQTVKNLPAVWETWIRYLDWRSPGKIPWRRAWQPTPVFLPGESPWGAWWATTECLSAAQQWWLSGKESACQCRRCGFGSLGWKDLLEKEMATYFALEISWTEEPGMLYSPWGYKKVRHDLCLTNNSCDLTYALTWKMSHVHLEKTVYSVVYVYLVSLVYYVVWVLYFLTYLLSGCFLHYCEWNIEVSQLFL